MDKNLGGDNKMFEPSLQDRKKNFNDNIKGMKKTYQSADDRDYPFPQNHNLNDIEEDEIEFRKKRN